MPNIKNGDTSEHTKRNATYSLAKCKAINNLTKENIYNSSPSSYLLWVSYDIEEQKLIEWHDQVEMKRNKIISNEKIDMDPKFVKNKPNS